MISVVLPTHNPDSRLLEKTLGGLACQSLGQEQWELLIVDNASSAPVRIPEKFKAAMSAKVISEPKLGLTAARIRGIREARGEILVFVDDDNLLCPGHLATLRLCFEQHPRLGAAGGPVVPEFVTPPAMWTQEFWGLLALQEHGTIPLIANGSADAPWPAFAPVGAGLCIRKVAGLEYVNALQDNPLRAGLDRRGNSLASGGDNDMVFSLLHSGWDVGYFPGLQVTHVIPPRRLEPAYLARLNEAIQRTWVQVIALHNQCPWKPVSRWSLPLRMTRAWWREQAWKSPSHYIRWRGLVGRFLGLAEIGKALPSTLP